MFEITLALCPFKIYPDCKVIVMASGCLIIVGSLVTTKVIYWT